MVFGQFVALSSVIVKRSPFCQMAVPSPPPDQESRQSMARTTKEIAMLFEGGFSFANFLMDVLAVFVFVVWLLLLLQSLLIYFDVRTFQAGVRWFG